MSLYEATSFKRMIWYVHCGPYRHIINPPMATISKVSDKANSFLNPALRKDRGLVSASQFLDPGMASKNL